MLGFDQRGRTPRGRDLAPPLAHVLPRPTAIGTARGGLGLGLSISRRSVEANDGILSVRNIHGSGCVFTIDLPRHSLPVVSAVSTV